MNKNAIKNLEVEIFLYLVFVCLISCLNSSFATIYSLLYCHCCFFFSSFSCLVILTIPFKNKNTSLDVF